MKIRVILIALVLGTHATVASSLFAGDAEQEAMNHFGAGEKLLKAEDFKAAAFEFEASFKIHPTINALLMLAECYKALHRYDDSFLIYERIQIEFGNTLTPDMALKIKDETNDILAITARLEITVLQPGAIVSVDGMVVSQRSYLISPGVHTIQVTLDGYEPASRTVLAYATATLGEGFDLVPIAVPDSKILARRHTADKRAPAGSIDKQYDRIIRSPLPFIAAASATVVLGITTIAVDTRVDDKFDDSKNASQWEDAENLQTADRVFFGITIAGLAATGALFFLTDFGGPMERPNQVAIDRIAPAVFEQGAGMAVQGRF